MMRRRRSWMTMGKANRSKGPNQRRERAVVHKNCARGSAFVSVSRIYKHCVHCLHFFFVQRFKNDSSGWKKSMRCTSMHKNFFIHFDIYMRLQSDSILRSMELKDWREKKTQHKCPMWFVEMTQPPNEDKNKP